VCVLPNPISEKYSKRYIKTVTKPFIQTINTVHKELWNRSDNGEITGQEIKNIIKIEAGHTVVKKYFNELENFNRIEQVPETQTWIVKQPEEAGVQIQKDGEKKAKQVMIPEDVLQASEQYGVNFSAVMTEALIDEISDKEQFVEDYLGEEYSTEETEFIFKLLKEDLYRQQGDKQQMARRGKRRRQMYTQVFDTDTIKTEESNHIENLRKEAFKLHEYLDL